MKSTALRGVTRQIHHLTLTHAIFGSQRITLYFSRRTCEGTLILIIRQETESIRIVLVGLTTGWHASSQSDKNLV